MLTSKITKGFLIKSAFAVAAGILVGLLKLDTIEFFLYDIRSFLTPAGALSDNIVIVLTDKDSISKLGKYPDFSSQFDTLQKILASKPNAVLYTNHIESFSGNASDRDRFLDIASKSPNVFQVTEELKMKGQLGELRLQKPFEEIKLLSAPIARDVKSFAKDGTTRRMMLKYQDQEMAYKILGKAFNTSLIDEKRISGLFNWIDSEQLFISFAKKGAFKTIKFEDVLTENFDPTLFHAKLILFGDDIQKEISEYYQTPASKSIDAMTAVEVHANSFETLIRNSAPVRAPEWLNVILTIVISILTVHVVLTLKPLKGILILLGTFATFTLVSYLAFWVFRLWVDMAHPYLAIFLCYYFFIPYRLIVENRRSWEYFQKHKLLSEVEQLKTNFIGMMSHDLKTPLARIQGMTEVITKDAAPLSVSQREALDTIKQSSEDLTKFISTILNYAKIESSGIELHKQAKDINQILKEVVKKHEFHAKLKHIQVMTELEPLFSIEVDADLLRQVFSNLLENALKYSPESSKVLITSEETHGKIQVQISDQGMGIPSDELPNIFMKFFRSKHAKSSPIKGSGLGLYLAKYFIELHGGSISAESSPGQGSTFTVELPL